MPPGLRYDLGRAVIQNEQKHKNGLKENKPYHRQLLMPSEMKAWTLFHNKHGSVRPSLDRLCGPRTPESEMCPWKQAGLPAQREDSSCAWKWGPAWGGGPSPQRAPTAPSSPREGGLPASGHACPTLQLYARESWGGGGLARSEGSGTGIISFIVQAIIPYYRL